MRIVAILRSSSILLISLFLPTPPALAGDVEVELATGDGFVIKNAGGATERLRIDETTGNISRNGALFVHTTGTENTFVGEGAGNLAMSGVGGNSAFGAAAYPDTEPERGLFSLSAR